MRLSSNLLRTADVPTVWVIQLLCGFRASQRQLHQVITRKSVLCEGDLGGPNTPLDLSKSRGHEILLSLHSGLPHSGLADGDITELLLGTKRKPQN